MTGLTYLRRSAPLLVAALAACGHPRVATRPAPAPPILVAAPTAVVASTGPTAEPAGTAAGSTESTPLARDVTQRAVAVFGDSLATDSADDEGPTWDIDVRSYENQARVAHYVQQFTGSDRDQLLAQMERGTRYEPMIRAKLHAAGLPEDMTYLALIESGYYPDAYSRAAAVGMWQLMTSTARGAGLRVDSWVDERRDPVRSTDAAISFLRYLRDQFGSLYLAAAAYNGGPGRVSRGLSRYADDLNGTSGDDVFFALAQKDYLRAETRNYVPQLIAAALIAKDPTHYGFVVRPQPAFAYDSVRVPATTPLAAIAHAAKASVAEEAELNPELLRGMTPPKSPRWVRVPPGRADGFEAAFEALPASERAAFRRVAVQKRQSLGSLADGSGVSARQIAAFNPGLEVTKKGLLVPGQTVLVPTPAVVAAARDVPDPAIERYGSSSGSRKATIHVVKKGESLDRIASHYKTSVATLKRLNHLRKDAIFPGQPLVVSGATKSTAHASTSRARARAGTASSKAASSRSKASASKPKASTKQVTRHTATKKKHKA